MTKAGEARVIALLEQQLAVSKALLVSAERMRQGDEDTGPACQACGGSDLAPSGVMGGGQRLTCRACGQSFAPHQEVVSHG